MRGTVPPFPLCLHGGAGRCLIKHGDNFSSLSAFVTSNRVR